MRPVASQTRYWVFSGDQRRRSYWRTCPVLLPGTLLPDAHQYAVVLTGASATLRCSGFISLRDPALLRNDVINLLYRFQLGNNPVDHLHFMREFMNHFEKFHAGYLKRELERKTPHLTRRGDVGRRSELVVMPFVAKVVSDYSTCFDPNTATITA